MPRLIVALALLLLWTAAAAAQQLPALHRVTGVAGDDVLNIRAEPSASAPVLGSFQPGEDGVEVLRLSPDGRWGLVGLPEGPGWVAMRFLAREAPGPGSLPRPLRCVGTEPFWSLQVSGDAAVFATPERETPLRPLGEAGGFVGTVAAFDAGGETLDLTVVRRDCSDGMSDRPYGFTALVWNRGELFLEGCCTLSAR